MKTPKTQETPAAVLDLSPEATRREVVAQLWREARDPKATSSSRTKALKLLDDLAKTQPVEPPPLPEGPAADEAEQTEGQRLLDKLELDGTSRRAVGAQVGVSHAAITDYHNGTRPGADVRLRFERRFEIPIASWDEPARPPPPKAAAEVLAELHLDQGFHHFASLAGSGFPFTPAQSAMAKVCFDGVGIEDLEGVEREVALEIFGPIHHIPERARATVAMECGRFSGKTAVVSRYVGYRLLTANIAETFTSAVPAFAILAPSTRTSSILFDQAAAFLSEIPEVKRRIRVANAQEVLFDRPTDGRTVGARLYPRSPAGRELRGQDFVGLAVDEAQFTEQTRGGEGLIRDADQIEAAEPRLRGPTILLSSLWAGPSYMRDVVEGNWGKPATAIVVKGKTLTMRKGGAGYADVEAARAAMLADPAKRDGARREYDLIADDGESVFYEASLVDAAEDPDIGPATGENVAAGMDLGFRLDNSVLAITERRNGRVELVACYVRRPAAGRALDPEIVTREFAQIARRHGATYLCTDSHSAEETRRACAAAGIVADVLDRSQLTPAAERLRTLLIQRRFAIPSPSETRPELAGAASLARELKSIRSKPGPGGTTEFFKPRIPGAGHCDVASALEMAVYDDARRYGPFPVRELTRFAPGVYAPASPEASPASTAPYPAPESPASNGAQAPAPTWGVKNRGFGNGGYFGPLR